MHGIWAGKTEKWVAGATQKEAVDKGMVYLCFGTAREGLLSCSSTTNPTVPLVCYAPTMDRRAAGWTPQNSKSQNAALKSIPHHPLPPKKKGCRREEKSRNV